MIQILAPISIGELIDKITILEIKSIKIKGEAIINIKNELIYLTKVLEDINININVELVESLKRVNEQLWDIEDKIRRKEKVSEFDDIFIKLARSVYITNDKRANIKRKINLIYGSSVVEEKSYYKY